MFEAIGRHPPARVAIRVGMLDIGYARLLADVMAAAAALSAKCVSRGAKVGIRAGSVANGHSYANWVAHLATLHLGAIIAAAGHRALPVQAELGGCNATIIDRSADLDLAATDLAAAMLSFSGLSIFADA